MTLTKLPTTSSVAIIGGGASGVLTAINLLAGTSDPDLRVTLHEAAGIVGRGLAYGTSDPRHFASSVVLAYGNLPPSALVVDGDEIEADASWHLTDPWGLGALRLLPPAATVVVVGTGLTAVDTAITLLEDGPGRRVVMVSRHGLLPHAHVGPQSTAWVTQVPEGPPTAGGLAQLFADQVAAAARQGVDWRAVVDGLRAPSHDRWQRLGTGERRRFLAVHARHWEVRRHRMAPEVAGRPLRGAVPGRRGAGRGAGGGRLHRTARRHHPQPGPAAPGAP